MSTRYQIRSAILIAVLVVLASFALLFALSVIGKEDSAGRQPNIGAPIIFPTQNQDAGAAAPTRTPAAIATRTPAAIPIGDERR